MSGPTHDMDENWDDHELLEPMVRFSGSNALLVMDDGRSVDLNALPNPFTGDAPQARPAEARPATDGNARLGRKLRAARENAGLTLAEIAKRVDVPANRVSQLEKGQLEPSLSIVTGLVRAAGVELSDFVSPDAPEMSTRALMKIATAAGASRDVVDRLAAVVGHVHFGSALTRAYAWTTDALFQGEPRSYVPTMQMAFKTTKEPPALDAPTLALARVLSEVTVEQFGRSYTGIPADPEDLRREILGTNGEISLDSLVRWAWDAGIVVLPLIGRGEFTAAVWTINEVPVIVLKDARTVGAYWLFDLAHELGHLAHRHVDDEPLVDVDKVESPDLDDEQERQANDYALRLLLPDPGALLTDVRQRTRGDAPKNFKFAVRDVADEARVSRGVLGFVAAREMSDVPADKDRWGSAHNLAKDEDPDGRQRVEDAFRGRIRLRDLDPLDAALLSAAVLRDPAE